MLHSLNENEVFLKLCIFTVVDKHDIVKENIRYIYNAIYIYIY
jgi:hypothetical protein